MTKIRIERCIDHVENDVINFINQFIHIRDPIVIHLQFYMNGVEHIFNGTITRPIWCSKDNTITRILDQVKYEWVFVDVQVVHRETKGPPRTI